MTEQNQTLDSYVQDRCESAAKGARYGDLPLRGVVRELSAALLMLSHKVTAASAKTTEQEPANAPRYGIGDQLTLTSFHMWAGPTLSLDQLLGHTGRSEDSCILRLNNHDGEQHQVLYRWSNAKGWVKKNPLEAAPEPPKSEVPKITATMVVSDRCATDGTISICDGDRVVLQIYSGPLCAPASEEWIEAWHSHVEINRRLDIIDCARRLVALCKP